MKIGNRDVSGSVFRFREIIFGAFARGAAGGGHGHARQEMCDRAIDYLKQNTPNSEGECVDAINRYIVMPSQATAYKIGMLKILGLREKAKHELGTKFDIRRARGFSKPMD